MTQKGAISGFSKLSAEEKIRWLEDTFELTPELLPILRSHLHSDPPVQKRYEEFSENTLSNFYMPFGIAPNFLINGRWYAIPMVIEESSVVAAASHAAKFWSARGGFHAEIPGTKKSGQVHFFWTGKKEGLAKRFEEHKKGLLEAARVHSASMEKRGGGIMSIEMNHLGDKLEHLYQLDVKFKTADAMGANFINTVLETLAAEWKKIVEVGIQNKELSGELEINMAILSNYTPESSVKINAECHVDELAIFDSEGSGRSFAEKFVRAIEIAKADPYRAVTHNKGIFNGVDAVVLATGNDFRAVEACGHTYASRDGQYRSLSNAWIEEDQFHFEMDIAMAVGTVGGLTNNHPLARISLQILQNPGAEELMMIIAAAGFANNFSAVRSLVTTGIQKGHMKMHLKNILHQLSASEKQKAKAIEYFRDKTISFAEVKSFLAEEKN